MSSIIMDICIHLFLSSWLSYPYCMAKIFKVALILSFLPCWLVQLTSTILYHFQGPWPCLMVTRWTESKTCWLSFLHAFQLVRMNLIWFWSNSSWTSWYYFWLRFIESRTIAALLNTQKKMEHWHEFGHLWTSSVLTWYNDRYNWNLLWDCLRDLD